jgi:hypothetical protein
MQKQRLAPSRADVNVSASYRKLTHRLWAKFGRGPNVHHIRVRQWRQRSSRVVRGGATEPAQLGVDAARQRRVGRRSEYAVLPGFSITSAQLSLLHDHRWHTIAELFELPTLIPMPVNTSTSWRACPGHRAGRPRRWSVGQPPDHRTGTHRLPARGPWPFAQRTTMLGTWAHRSSGLSARKAAPATAPATTCPTRYIHSVGQANMPITAAP